MFKIKFYNSSLCLLGIALLLSACSPSQTTKPQALPSCALIAWPWYKLSYRVFIDNEYDDIESFAGKLSELLNQVNTDCADMASDWRPYDVLWIPQTDVKQSSAQTQLLENMQKMFVAHNMASFGKITLSVNDTSFIQQRQNWKTYLESLAQLDNTTSVFSRGEFEIYAANTSTGLLAYQRTFEGKRAYVAFNFSFDVHEMPLPLGFMSSTKITLWQTDSPEIRRFVTSAPLSIRPFTGAIVLLN